MKTNRTPQQVVDDMNKAFAEIIAIFKAEGDK